MQIRKEILSEYARLIVRTGANVQPGQVVQLSIAVEQHEFAAMITEEAYLAGAKKVNLNWLSDGQDRLHYRYADEETLAVTLPWEEEKLRQMTKDLPVRIFIESEDPDALAGLDPETENTSGALQLCLPNPGQRSASRIGRRKRRWLFSGMLCFEPSASEGKMML